MPWKEANAVEQRLEFVQRAVRGELPFAQLCREFGIAPRTGYKWKQRYELEGLRGLNELSRRPHSCQSSHDENCICELIRLKNLHTAWGPEKIRELYRRASPAAPLPSLSSVQRILGKAGLVNRRRPRRCSASLGRISGRFEPTAPNQLWSVDFKGWWYSSRSEKVLPLTVCDAFSRFVLLVEVVPDAKGDTVRACFARLFEQYGLPLCIRSDNGSPFACTSAPLGLSRLSVWWLAQGISLDRIRPGSPQENGRHERMHRDIAMEVEGRVNGGLAAQQAALSLWREDYNQQRPHAALALGVPAELYRRSERRYEPELGAVEYPLEYWRRRVTTSGCIKVDGRLIMITTALRGWEVGLQPLAAGRFNIWFGTLRLGELNVQDARFAPERELTYTVQGGNT